MTRFMASKAAERIGAALVATVVLTMIGLVIYGATRPNGGIPAGEQRVPGLSGYLGMTEPKGTIHAEPTANHPEGDRGTAITEVRLSDGTRCAVMDAPQGKALSCDWKAGR